MPRVPKPIFCYVTDRRAFDAPPDPRASIPTPLQDSIRRAIAAGIGWIQIREKDLEARSLLELARFAVAAARQTAALVLINDRLDVAMASRAAGVHLGENSLPVSVVSGWRRSSGRPDFLIGASCHSLESVRAAERDGADYVFFGPIFATPSKAAFGAPQGIEQLSEVCAAVKIPALAIGGVNLENARTCRDAGAAGIAAIRLFQDAKNSTELAAQLKSMERHHQ